MKKELIVSVSDKKLTIAMLEDDALVELHRDDLERKYSVGDIYLGKVRKVLPALNAAFIDIGSEREAFVHYHDLGEHFLAFNRYVQSCLNDRRHIQADSGIANSNEEKTVSEAVGILPKDGKIEDVLVAGQYIMVQIIKEPINTKGPRLTGEISLAGRNIVLMPRENRISVSQKIKSHSERNRLRRIVADVKKNWYGVIIRTVADGQVENEIENEVRAMEKRWLKVLDQLKTAQGITQLYEESSRTVSILRDLFTPDYQAIYVDDDIVFSEVYSYVELIAPEKVSCVKPYRDTQPIFDHFDITKNIKSQFARTVSFKRGSYLIIDKAEAMHVIDVNSGSRMKADKSPEEISFEVNMAAADEIARQLRLRDIGGIIVVDFIDMMEPINRQKLYEHMLLLMSHDRAKHNILPLSKFGLMQITRQRVRPALEITTDEVCPTCGGTGRSGASILLVDEIEERVEQAHDLLHYKWIKLEVHPYVSAYIRKGFISTRIRWQLQYGIHVHLVARQQLGMLEYKFFDIHGDEINFRAIANVVNDR